MIIDAQIHIWDVDRPERPWPQPPRNLPQLPNGFSAEQALEQMDASGVDRAVIVPPIYAGDENANLTAFEACERHPGRFAIMGRFDPAWGPQRLETWKSQPHMLGIRISMTYPAYSTWMDDGTLDWFWPVAERLRIPVMLLLPHALPQAKRVAERHPGLQLFIDHLGCVLPKQGPAAFANIDQLLAMAATPNVAVKVTSAPCFSEQGFPFADIHPYLRRIYEAFGPQRMLWGTDFTRLRGTYDECLRIFRDELDFLSAEDKDWVLGKSASKLLGWPE
ncbi:MAG TPA: amidohydrolase family protein [Dehalococcoidia bacterium]|nr:amidohydrolase family protein [Dehalococcoidia bacterium]